MSSEMIQVPRRLIQELSSYLEHAGDVTISVPGNGEWTERMITQLKAEGGRFRGAIAVGDRAAAKAGELVGLGDVAQRAGISKQQISNDLAAMSKATRRLFGARKWPFQAVDTSQGMHYLMQPEMADWWEAH